jgi:hypothetical protein
LESGVPVHDPVDRRMADLCLDEAATSAADRDPQSSAVLGHVLSGPLYDNAVVQ